MNKDRLAVAIGKNGITKRKIQYLTNTIIEIDSETGDYTIQPSQEPLEISPDIENFYEQLDISPDTLNIYKESPNFGLWTAKKILEAINIGFKPEKTFKLVNQDYIFEKISLFQLFHQSVIHFFLHNPKSLIFDY